jgi:hypothetical protein
MIWQVASGVIIGGVVLGLIYMGIGAAGMEADRGSDIEGPLILIAIGVIGALAVFAAAYFHL